MLKLEELKLSLLLAGFKFTCYSATEFTNTTYVWDIQGMQIQMTGELALAEIDIKGHPDTYVFYTNKEILDVLGVLNHVNQIG